MGIWLISLLFPAPAIINQCRFSAVAFSAQRLQVALIIGPAARLRNDVINGIAGCLIALGTDRILL
jgi:hypothetical protein